MADQALLIDTDKATGVRTLTLNRPHRKNAVDEGLWHRLHDAMEDAGQDPVLVLTGAGGDFCLGADISPGGRSGHPLTRMRSSTRSRRCCTSSHAICSEASAGLPTKLPH